MQNPFGAGQPWKRSQPTQVSGWTSQACSSSHIHPEQVAKTWWPRSTCSVCHHLQALTLCPCCPGTWHPTRSATQEARELGNDFSCPTCSYHNVRLVCLHYPVGSALHLLLLVHIKHSLQKSPNWHQKFYSYVIWVLNRKLPRVCKAKKENRRILLWVT
jgi:hypothetical protein